ncbi:MAG TPA: alcohol dehydrogenase catalytic domain-containing protein [Solirubrobacteraceae bacterium]|nr:alcohol dehydrogenase catalytic domain-containing protein [Solirubrobacteraceae bacterium]
MRQLTYHGQRRLSVQEVPPRDLQPGEVRVRVDSTGVCTSDVYGYSGRNDRRDRVLGSGEVLVMGHEASGVVCELGPRVDGPSIGTPVAINPIVGCGHCPHCIAGAENRCDERTVMGCAPNAPGGFADMMIAPARNVVELPEGVSLELGALVEPLSVGAHAVALAQPGADQSVLVIGGGIIGIGAALAARRRTDGLVLVLEPQVARRELCSRLGLHAMDPAAVLGGAISFDLALDCVARPETISGAIRAVVTGGLVMLVGIWEDSVPLPVSDVVWRETRIAGSYGYSTADFADVAEWLGRGEVDLTPIIERRVGFAEVIDTFDAYADGTETAVRTLLQPSR